jgi:hypothetical protein
LGRVFHDLFWVERQLDFLKATWRWLWRARAAALFVLGFVAAFALAYWYWPDEVGLRYGGLLLELGGIVTVWWGILETRELFGHPGFWAHTRKWLAESPIRSLWRRRDTRVTLDVGAVFAAPTGSMLGWVGLPPDATIAQRIKKLEEDLKKVATEFHNEQKKTAQEFSKLSENLNQERHQREVEDAKIRETMTRNRRATHFCHGRYLDFCRCHHGNHFR